MFGKLLYQFRTRFGHGIGTAWQREVVRQRILKAAPVIADDASVCEIHVLTSAGDWLNLMWALKSFYWASGRRYALCIHDDGSLTSDIRRTLGDHFPAARILDRNRSDLEVLRELSGYPRCREFRKTNRLAPKVFDFRHFLKSERMLLLDSDVLFFKPPSELLRRIEDPLYSKNSVNADVASAYTVDPAVVRQQCDVELIQRFNSGLGVIHRRSIEPGWIEGISRRSRYHRTFLANRANALRPL